ncbi:MMPL family transporter [Streptomyces sp. NPDC057238]|uniref:MMPL family transporter n=1 Tax=Streptomyces sp. NPDC057238 TaxID=3346060 RepID=UPI00364107E8
MTATAAVLRLATLFTPVSVFASSISYALGLVLAVDYSLFIISRFREELDNGHSVEGSLRATMSTAGRAVAFSAATVATSLAALFIFPLPILRSIALGGITVTVSAAALSLLVLPAALCLLGRLTHRFDLFAPLRRGRATRAGTMTRAGTNDQDMLWSAGGPTGTERGFWGRIAALVMRRPAVVSLALAAGLAVMASPFTRVEFGMFDDRLFPTTSEIGRSGQALRQDFTDGGITSPTTVMLPGFDPTTAADHLDRYARRLRGAASAPGGDRDRLLPEGKPCPGSGPGLGVIRRPAGAWLSVTTDCEPFSAQARRVALAVRALPAPAPALVGGPGAVLADMHQSIADRLWQACALIVAAMTVLVLVLALTRRPVLALKAVMLNALSPSATFGALVFVFQDGHFAGPLGGFTTTGTTDIQMPVLIFCIAFGLSMDYEVFLLARICEEYRRLPSTAHAVVAGLDRTAGLFTWAAVIFATVMAALATSDLVLLKVIGVGLALAVVLDATVIRGLLVPAVMAVAGRANWWTLGDTTVEAGMPARRLPHDAPSRTTEPQLPSARDAVPAPGPELPKGEHP